MQRNPFAPFATSTLQMDASRKLGFSAKQTMQVAQRLYEGVEIGGEVTGLITYMRTDGVTIIPEAVSRHPRAWSSATIRKRYLPPVHPRVQDQGQERAGGARGDPPHRRARASPQDVARYLDRDQARLYELIWKRTVASQMASAELEQTTADIEVKGRDGKLYGLRATGSVVQFEGFLKVYEEGRDDRVRVVEKGKEDHAEDDDSRRLPPLAQGDARHRSRASRPSSTSPSRRRAIRKPRWSSAWRSSASAGPPPTPPRSPCCRSATTSASTRSG